MGPALLLSLCLGGTEYMLNKAIAAGHAHHLVIMRLLIPKTMLSLGHKTAI